MSKRVKQFLMLFAALGVVAVALGGGSGTFAGFNAVVANNNNYFATGTLFLHETADGTTCTSEAATDNVNITNLGGTCDAKITVDLTSDTSAQYFALTLKNAGTLDASGLKFWSEDGCTSGTNAVYTDGTLDTGITNAGGAITSLSVNALTYGIPSGTVITLDDGVNTDTFTTSAAAAAGATSISVSSHTPAFDFNSGTDVKSSPSFGSGDLCGALQIGLEETTSALTDAAATACLYGTGSPSCTFSNTNTLATLPSSAQTLNLTSGGGDNNTNELTGIDAGGTRYLLFAVKPTSLDNTFQNKKATFDLRWQIDQA